MAKDDAGVAGARSNVVGAIADVGEAVVDTDWICASSVVMAMKLSESMVQVTWPMVNMRPFGVAMEPGMMTILFVLEQYAHPLPGVPLSTKYGRQST